MNFIDHILILGEYLRKNFGIHYPKDIIKLIIMSNYENIYEYDYMHNLF